MDRMKSDGSKVRRESLNMSTKEGSVLNADDLKLAEMGYKPVPCLPHGIRRLMIGIVQGVFYDVGYGVGV